MEHLISNKTGNSKYTTRHHDSGLPELSSSWFKLFLYHTTGLGPPSLLLPKGWKLRCLPPPLAASSTLLVTTWGHEPTIVPSQGVLAMLQVKILPKNADTLISIFLRMPCFTPPSYFSFMPLVHPPLAPSILPSLLTRSLSATTYIKCFHNLVSGEDQGD